MAILLTWNADADKKFESGLDRGVLYVKSAGAYPLGVAWEGLISVTEKPGGDEPTDLWANNIKYAQLFSSPQFDGSIEAYTYPEEFLPCDGVATHTVTGSSVYLAQQARTPFGLCYRTYEGDVANGQFNNYKIHVVYGCTVQPSEVARNTINDSPEALTFSWEFKTVPVASTSYGSVSHIIIDVAKLTAADKVILEETLYGDDTPTDPSLPLPDALLALLTGV